MTESEISLSSKDSKNLGESKIILNFNDKLSPSEIINNEFDLLEDWIDNQFKEIKKECLDKYNNFSVPFPNEAKKSDIQSINNEEDEMGESY